MMILVHKALVTLERYRHPNLGVLVSPRGGCRVEELPRWTWGVDNDSFLKWDEPAFERLLNRIDGVQGCRFVALPDVVGDASATLDKFADWKHVRESQPIALVAQDGLTIERTPWKEIDAIFIGGTTDWKLGAEARAIVSEARRRGLWVHMGRVNTRNRIRYARSIGCSSLDGSSFSRFSRTHLPWALKWASSEQLWEPDGAVHS